MQSLFTKFPYPSFSPRSIFEYPRILLHFLIQFENSIEYNKKSSFSTPTHPTSNNSHRFPTKFGEESLRDTSFTAFPTDQSLQRPTPPRPCSPLFSISSRDTHGGALASSGANFTYLWLRLAFHRGARQWLRISVVAHTYVISSVSSAFDGAEDAARLPPVAVGKARLAALCHHGDYIAVSARNIESHERLCVRDGGGGVVEARARQTGMNVAQYVAQGVAYSTRRYFESLLKHRDASFVRLKTRILGRIFASLTRDSLRDNAQ